MRTLPQLLELPERELRHLVEVGEPPDRLRAAWAIGLRFGASANAVLREAAAGEITQGLRQQLVVILAGLGEKLAVLEVARSDPHESVRAVATAYTIRTAPSSSDGEARSFAQGKLAHDTPEVRIAVLNEIVAGRLTLDARTILPILDAGDVVERRAALLALVAMAADDPMATDGLSALVSSGQRLAEESIAELGRADAISLLRALSDAKAATLDALLRTIAKGRLELGWNDLAFLLARTEVSVANALLRTTRACPAEAALPWLVHAYVASTDEHDVCRVAGWSYIATLLSRENVGEIAEDDRRGLRAAVQHRRDVVAKGLADTDLDEDYFDYREYYESELDTISRVEAILDSAG